MRALQWIAAGWIGLGGVGSEVIAADAADRYPTRPIRIVVGGTPGSSPDVLARMIG
jgi:tripartite-type tricarboxylate transporter receptor subunit TctC